MNLLDGLNEPQLAAVTLPPQHALILADKEAADLEHALMANAEPAEGSAGSVCSSFPDEASKRAALPSSSPVATNAPSKDIAAVRPEPRKVRKIFNDGS